MLAGRPRQVKSETNNMTAISKTGAHISLQQTEKLSTDFQNNSQNRMTGCHHLGQMLDIGGGTLKDCSTSFATSNKDSKPSNTGASIKTKLTAHHGDKTSVFSMLRESAQHW
jgi:hypothetical protein